MDEMWITVEVPGKETGTYRFREFPVRVGRSAECHLSICHEAVPRELFHAWLEDRGRTVRVEERPGLTNPLLRGVDRVNGGVSGGVLELSVGPIAMRLGAGQSSFIDRGHGKPGFHLSLAAVGLGIVVVLAAIFFFHKRRTQSAAEPLEGFPMDPFCDDVQDTCPSRELCREKARLLDTRGKELLSRPGKHPSNRIRGAALLDRGARLYGMAGAPEEEGLRAEADAWKELLRTEYRRELLSMRRRLDNGDVSMESSAPERRLSEYLVDCEPRRRSTP